MPCCQGTAPLPCWQLSWQEAQLERLSIARGGGRGEARRVARATRVCGASTGTRCSGHTARSTVSSLSSPRPWLGMSRESDCAGDAGPNPLLDV